MLEKILSDKNVTETTYNNVPFLENSIVKKKKKEIKYTHTY